MVAGLIPYVIILLLGGVAAGLLTSKVLSEKLVAAGILPRTFLGLLPVVHGTMRVFGVTLILAGIVSVGIESGLINREYLARYGFAIAVIALGVLLVGLSRRRDR